MRTYHFVMTSSLHIGNLKIENLVIFRAKLIITVGQMYLEINIIYIDFFKLSLLRLRLKKCLNVYKK